MPKQHAGLNRRDFLKRLGLGIAGAAGAGSLAGKATGPQAGQVEKPAHHFRPGELYKNSAPPARVSLVKGSDRRDIVFRSLKMIEDEVLTSIKEQDDSPQAECRPDG